MRCILYLKFNYAMTVRDEDHSRQSSCGDVASGIVSDQGSTRASMIVSPCSYRSRGVMGGVQRKETGHEDQ